MSARIGYPSARRRPLEVALDALRHHGTNQRGGNRRADMPRFTLAQLAALYSVSTATLARARRILLAEAAR